MSDHTAPFVFQRQPPTPANETIDAAAARCRAVIPQLEELAAMLCLSGQPYAGKQVCEATVRLMAVLEQLPRSPSA